VGTAARLVTDLGNIDFVFFAGAAPLTVANFLNYLNRGDFNNSFFHRSVPGFVIQGGSFRADATASPIPTDPPVINEPLISNTRGTVSMAKIGGSPNSATSGFFISLADNAAILNPQNGGFTVFARVAGAGMTVVDAIATLPIQNYTSVRSALTDTPYRVPPATPYNPNNLARVLSTSFISPLSLSASSSNPVIANAGVSAGNLILTPISPGISTITLTATDLDGLTATTNFTFTVTPDTYESWAARQSFATAQDGLAGADPDRDGRSNLAEFALASPPLAPSEADLLPSITSGKLTFQFPLRQYTTGVTVTLESAEILNGPWTSQWSAQDGFPHPWITSAVTSGNAQIITARNPSAAILPRQFLRLKVTKP
jgi:peptidyl-prolyl cis-trans isomerase A (cyclophilin A)